MQKNILFLGFGELATGACAHLEDWHRVGVARSAKPVPAGVDYWQMAVGDAALGSRLQSRQFDCVVITLTPADTSDEGYRAAYVEPVARLLPVLQKSPPGLILFVSSTSVYGQTGGEWVDETSVTEPGSFPGQRLLEAEQSLLQSGLEVSILRLAGIYGLGRDYLLRQVQAGRGGDAGFTNRIHVDDAVGFIIHLIRQFQDGRRLEQCYLVADNEPAPGQVVRRWLAERMGMDTAALESGGSSRGGNKRCRNTRMLATGYRLLYPGFQTGYDAMLSGCPPGITRKK